MLGRPDSCARNPPPDRLRALKRDKPGGMTPCHKSGFSAPSGVFVTVHLRTIRYLDKGYVMFIELRKLQDRELLLALDRYLKLDPEREGAPTYYFNMVREGSSIVVVSISLRIGNPDRLVLYRGHIGYSVKPEYRGHHFAARSVRLLTQLAAAHKLNPVWITCDQDNFASRRTCELVGAEFVEIIDIPPEEELYHGGIRQKCRYRLVTIESEPPL
jgi:predicted acetyltransferase